MSPRGQLVIHGLAMAFWAVAVLPTLTVLRASIEWVAFVSIYANFATHWGAFEAARTEVRTEALERIN